MFTKIWKGLNELHQLELIGPVKTKMHVAQAAGCSPIYTAYKEGTMFVRPVKPNTIAKSLAIGNPADGFFALKTIKDSKGSAEAATDDEIVQGMRLLAETEGIFAETAGGVTIAALKHLAKSGAIKPDELTVAYITGNGLKTQEAVEEFVKPIIIQPTTAAFKEAMNACGSG